MDNPKGATLRFGAVGDLLLSTPPGSDIPGRGMEALSDEVRELFSSCDVVFANLECTLPGRGAVPTEPRVVSTKRQIDSLRDSGVDVVTLGNNHMFDCLDEGFGHLSGMLSDMGIHWFGAGRNLLEAQRPAVLDVGGIRLAFLGCVRSEERRVGFADEDNSGVAPLDIENLCEIISDVGKDVDHVIVSPHWGRERFRFPSPEQIRHARAFVDAGASMVLGHHPHVLQGMEIYHGAPVVYSLGNFIANNVYWQDGDMMVWNRFERTSCIFVADFDADALYGIQQIPTFDDGEMVRIESSGWGKRCLSRANRMLGQAITPKRYNRERIYIETVKPIISHLRWAELRRLRPYHLRKVWELLRG